MTEPTNSWQVVPTSESGVFTDGLEDVNATNTGQLAGSNLSDFSEVALKIVYIIIGCVGFLGNVLVIVVIFNSPSMRKKMTNVFIINQSFTDGLAALFVMGQGVFEHSGDGLTDSVGDFMLCSLWLTRAPLWSMLMSSTYNLLALTLERYMEIVHPIAHKNHFTKARARYVLIAVWVIGPAYNLAYEVPTSRVIDGVCYPFSIYPNALTMRVVGVLTVVLQWVIPIATMSYAYSRMALVVHRRIEPTMEGAAQKGIANRMARARRNIIKTLIIVCICFTLCWTWNEVFILLYFLGRPTDFGSDFYHFTVVAVFINCCVNPFIYAAKYEEFQMSLKKMFFRWKRGQTNGSDADKTAAPTVSRTVTTGAGLNGSGNRLNNMR